MTGGDGSTWHKNNDGSTTISKGGNTWVVGKHAKGTTSAQDGISLVGEQGPELRVLNQGDGILPSDITKNLWAWGSMSPASVLSTIANGTSASAGMSVVIQSLNLPSVQNGNDFVNYLKNNLWRKTVQFASK